MKFPSAAKGVSKLFTAEIISIIGILLIGVASSIYYSSKPLQKYVKEGGAVPKSVGTAFVTLAAIGFIFAMIAAIIKVIGVLQAAKDEPLFKAAAYIVVITIVVGIIVAIATGGKNESTFTGFTNTISRILELITLFLIIGGISHLSEEIGDDVMILKGARIINIIFWFYLLIIFANILTVFPENVITSSVAGILVIIATILSILAYCIYISFLFRAKIMLKVK